MKKLKIMLLSLALFAVVGGALAFKAKFSTEFCTTDWNGRACVLETCPDFIENQILKVGTPVICTEIAPNEDCTTPQGVVQCADAPSTTIEGN